MDATALLESYNKNGYVIIEDAIAPDQLQSVQLAYEDVIVRAMDTDHAERDAAMGFLSQHRFQNPHHPDLARPEIMTALAPENVIRFCHQLMGPTLAFYGVAAFAMQEEYDYLGSWHRDSYAAWGKDSVKEQSIRERSTWPCTQVLLALHDDACLWVVPGSHNRSNTDEEEALFESGKTGWQETFPGAIQLKLKAGSAAPFDSRAIHRGLKRPGGTRRSLFSVYGAPSESRDSMISEWAQDPVYQNPEYLKQLPADLRCAVMKTCEILAKE